jgi:tetratricopeptide (TPR) repeat protein
VLHIGASHNPLEVLLQALQSEKLLVLDNLEHLPMGELLTQMLAAAPELRLICTSREVLGLHQEQLLELGGLAALKPDKNWTIQDSAQIFLQAAKRSRPDFRLTESDFAALAQIERLVGGMPLGLELAAGWVRLMTLPEIADALQANQDLLESNAADLPERQRSLKQVFQATWKRLSVQEQDALAQIALLRGSFDLAFATQVTGLSAVLLLRLVNKSLLGRDGTRFFVHELIRQNALSHLTPESRHATLERLSQAVLHITTRWTAHHHSAEHVHVSRAVTEIYENIRLVLEQPLTPVSLQISADLTHYWYTRGQFEEGLLWLGNAKNQPNLSPTLHTKFQFGYANIARQMGHFAECYTIADQLAQGDQLDRAYAQKLRGDTARDQQDLERAKTHTQRARAELAPLDQYTYGRATLLLGLIEEELGNYQAAIALLEPALELLRQNDDYQGISYTLEALSTSLGKLGDRVGEKNLLLEAMRMGKQMGDELQVGNCLFHLADNANATGQFEEAKRLHLESLEIFWRGKFVLNLPDTLLSLAELERPHNPDTALRLLGAAQKQLLRLGRPPTVLQHGFIQNIRANIAPSVAELRELEGEMWSLEQAVQVALAL